MALALRCIFHVTVALRHGFHIVLHVSAPEVSDLAFLPGTLDRQYFPLHPIPSRAPAS